MPKYIVDQASSNDTYLCVDIAAHLISLQIKIEAEGVIVDAFPMHDCTGSDSLATMACESLAEAVCRCDEGQGPHEHCTGCGCILTSHESPELCRSCERIKGEP